MSQLEYFRFEVMPERPAGYPAFTDPFTAPWGVPSYRIEIAYGGRKYGMASYMPPGDLGITESFLEHLIRQAVSEFKKAVNKEGDDKAKAELDAAVSKAADAYAAKVRRA